MKFTLEIDLSQSMDTDQEKRDNMQTIMKELSTKVSNLNLMEGIIRNGNNYVIGLWRFEE